MHNHFDDTEHEVMAHMSMPEIKELSRFMGGVKLDPVRNIPTFMPLKDVVSHGHVYPSLQEWSRRHAASGGAIDHQAHQMRSAGRNGDTHLVVLPRHLANILDPIATRNPQTGKREFFLGNLFGGLFDTLKNVGGGVFNALKSVGGNMLSNFAPQIGQALGQQAGGLAEKLMPGSGQMVSGLANNLGQSAAQQGGSYLSNNSTSSPNTDAMAQAATHGMQGYMGGMSPQDAAYATAQNYGNNANANPYASMAARVGSNTAQNMRGGSSFADALKGSAAPEASNFSAMLPNLMQGASELLPALG